MNANPIPIVVINTQLFLRATLNHRSLPAKLLFELGEYYVLAVSPGILDEVQDVLNRPKLRNKFTGLTDEAVARTLTVLAGAQQATPDMVPAVSRDSKDDIFLATAVTSGAQYLVTEDKDLLVLDPYQGIRILDALAFLRIIQPSV
ncbi:MAG TPA: putative toxin-antitoxin system toxin component, PIN family [Longimicrobium sp.]